jgi:hypothetical protein
MLSKADIRAFQAAHRRNEREAQKRKRELDRTNKEQEKLSAMEQAQFEVRMFENQLEILLSLHKERGDAWDWASLAAAIAPPPPAKRTYYQSRAQQRAVISMDPERDGSRINIMEAQARDDAIYKEALLSHAKEGARSAQLQLLACEIVAGSASAYRDALAELNPFEEIFLLGSALQFTVHDQELIECTLKTNGNEVLPREQKALTSTGKLAVKAMPKNRYHALHQDYLCSCVLRVAREVFSLLPVKMLLLTAISHAVDTSTGQIVEKPVLSVAISREKFAGLDFDRLDPSDSMEVFTRRGDLKAARKSEGFQEIVPLTAQDLDQEGMPATSSVDVLLEMALTLRESIRKQSDSISRIQSPPKVGIGSAS